MTEIRIGGRIRAGRKNKGLSQSQFADKLFVSKQAVGKWERDECLPDLFMLVEISKIIGVTDLNYFLGGSVRSCLCDHNCACCNTVPPDTVHKI
jgi:transcriptional regulator with XRE-family HTH domain